MYATKVGNVFDPIVSRSGFLAIVSIFDGIFCGGEEVADGITARSGYERIDRKLLVLASERYGVSESSLMQTMQGPTPLFDKLTHQRARNLAYLKLVLGELIASDNVVYYGLAGHLLPRDITHVLRVCLVASIPHRIHVAMAEEGISEKEARRQIRESDHARARWTSFLCGRDPYEDDLYDTVIPMHSTTPSEAVANICHLVRQPALQTSEKSRQAVRDFVLGAEVSRILAENGHEVAVTCSNGRVTITLEKYVLRLKHYKEILESLVSGVEGVKSINVVPGDQFVPPSLTRDIDLEIPSKVLLVDDEREFVHTLSERLQARNFSSSVSYDGETALSSIQTDEPEVMVLDLKMPGIDGIEVLRRVKRDHPDVEVIILTGHGSEREERLAEELGAFAYLQKPVDVDELALVMKGAYKKARSKTCVPPGDE